MGADMNLVETTSGTVRGTGDRGVRIFKGIPYGAPTGGAARFLPPQPFKSRGPVLAATGTGPKRLQTGSPGLTGGDAKSEESPVGKACGRACRSRWSPQH